jgi:hypothetical protein
MAAAFWRTKLTQHAVSMPLQQERRELSSMIVALLSRVGCLPSTAGRLRSLLPGPPP